ncbi:MAG: hypothetical protein EOP32_35515 [Rhodococcus sp. (in: high G+C Gram-positive bacteria)]|nr:MAG: hypothetical protein EOP32_35515 [Rhodococcus sp. (in: high G+C Gram-positive bacteria)]
MVTGAGEAVTATAGAVGGAAVGAVAGSVRGAAGGVRDGVKVGSHSTPAALLTMGAIGAAGLVEWPIVLGAGGTALVLHQLHSARSGKKTATKSATSSADGDQGAAVKPAATGAPAAAEPAGKSTAKPAGQSAAGRKPSTGSM